MLGIAGYGAVLAWSSLLVWSDALFDMTAYSDFEGHLLRGVFLVATAIAFLLFRLFPPLSKRNTAVFAVVLAVLAPASTVSMLLGLDIGASCACWAISGIADALLLGLWQHYFAGWNQKQTLVITGMSFVFNAVIMAIFTLLPMNARPLFSLVCPYTAILAFLGVRARLQLVQAEHYEEHDERISIKRFFVNEVTLSAFCNILVGFTVSYATSEAISVQTSLPLAFALAIAGAVMIALTLFVHKNLAFKFLGALVPYTAIMLIAFAFGNETVRVIAICAILVMLSCFEILSIANLSRNARFLFDNRSDALVVSRSLNRFAFVLGWTVGFLVVEHGDLVPGGTSTVAFVLLGFISIVIVFRLYRIGSAGMKPALVRKGKTGTDDVSEQIDELALEPEKPQFASLAEELGDTETTYGHAIETVASEFKLSKREREVFEYLARGRDAKSISEKMVLSVHTVRTHTYNIYAKLNVHSHQELIDLVDSYRPEQ